MTTIQNTSHTQGPSFGDFSRDAWAFISDAIDPFQLRDRHLLEQVAANIQRGSVALEDATRVVYRAIDPVSDQLRGWYSTTDLKTVRTCHLLVSQYEAAAVDREGEGLREVINRVGYDVGQLEAEHSMTSIPAVTLDLRGHLAMVAGALEAGPISKGRAQEIVDRSLESLSDIPLLGQKHLESLAICLLAVDDEDLNDIFPTKEADTRRYLHDLVRVNPITDLKNRMSDAGVDFLAVASRVAQGRFPVKDDEVSDIDLATREEWLNDILNEVGNSQSFNHYDSARLLMKAHALIEYTIPGIEEYHDAFFTQTGELRTAVRDELSDVLAEESPAEDAVTLMRLRSVVCNAAEHLSGMVADYDYTLRTDGKMIQPGMIDLAGGREIMVAQFAGFFGIDSGDQFLPDAMISRFRETFEKDLDAMLGRFAAEFYDPTSAGFISVFNEWRESSDNSWELSREQHVNLVSALLEDMGEGSGHPEALFDRYVAARDFIHHATLVPSSDDEMDAKVSVRMLLLKELEICVVSGLVEAAWTEEREALAQQLSERQERILAEEEDSEPGSSISVNVQSLERAVELFWDRFGNNTKNPGSGCILDRDDMAEILFERYMPLFTKDINGIIGSLNDDLAADNDEEG